MLALDTGSFDAEDTTKARKFYEAWQSLNAECIERGHEDAKGDLSFVKGQLDRILSSFPREKTVVSVLDVFPLSAGFGSAYVFGGYIVKLEQIASSMRST
jgi:hypothetical protein